MGKALTWIGGIVLAVLSALLIIPHLVDWNRYRGTFEEEASRALGREVRVGGGVNLRLLPSPYVRFERIRISDTAGTLGEPFFRAEGFTMGLAITPLLRGAIEATEIELQQPILTLAIDSEGRGNWRDVALAPAATFLPAEVRLKAVKIIGGQIGVKGNDGTLLQLNQIDGELSAEALAGPYKFRGSVAKDGVARDVRLATAEPDPDGAVRFKATVHAPLSEATYTLDGRLLDLGAKPRIDGELTARIPLPATAPTTEAPRKPADRDNLEIRSKLEGDAFGVVLPDIALVFEQGAQPQLVSGDARIGWRDGLRLKLSLASKWLDLDRIAASRPEAGPVEAGRTLLPTLVGLLPESGQVDAQLTVDQITLGGEVASAVRLHLERFRGPMLVRELHAGLPGGAKLDLTGTLTSKGGEHSFDGDLALRGTSHARFLGWAAKGQTLIDSRSDGSFSIGGRLSLTPTGFELTGLAAEWNGAPPLTGAIGYSTGGRRRLDLRLEGQQIDLTSLLPGGLDPERARALLWPSPPATPAAAAKPAPKPGLLGVIAPGTTDSHIVVRAAELGDGERVYRDVDATFSIEGGRLQISQARLTTADGLKLDLEGYITGITDPAPKGVVRATLVADTADAAGSLLAALDMPAGAPGKTRDALLARLAPARLAGSLRLGARQPTSTDLAFDGVVRGARAVARFDLDTGPARWRDGHVEARVRIDSADAALALAELITGDPASASGTAAAGAGAGTVASRALRGGSLSLELTGQPRNGILGLASLTAEGLTLGFDGRIAEPVGAARELDGIVRVDAARFEPVLSLLGLSGIGGLRDATLKGAVEVSSKADALRIKSRGLAVGGSEVAGILTLSRPEGGAVSADASLFVAKASLADLLAPVLAQRGPAPHDAASPIWPDRPFDAAAFDALQGRIKLAMGTLSLAPGLDLADASLEAELTPGQIKLTNLDGRALGGELKARLVLEKAPMAGAALAGALRIDDARLESLAGKSTATGAASLLAQFSGRALTPLALVQALQGKGELTLGSTQLLRHSPSTVPRAIDAVLDGKADAGGEALRKLLSEGLTAGTVRVPATKLALQIADGAVKVQKLDFATDDARGSLETTVELTSLKFDAEWRLQPKGPPKRVLASQSANKGALPGISLVYVGPLGGLPTIEPRMNTEALERVLVVLRMERDVEELERLRREDEERVRREIERQKALEEERKKALEESRASESSPGTTPATAAPASAPVTIVPAPLGAKASGPPPRFEVRPNLPPPGTASPAAPGTAAPSTSAQATLPGQTATDGAPLQPSPAATESPKRPARLGPPRPYNPQPPKFNPFGSPGIGAN